MKIFTGVVLERLVKWVNDNNKLSENQAGFRKGYSTIDNIFTLTTLARSRIEKGQKLYVFFVDFKAAFDSIDRNALFYKLSNIGISSKVLNVIKSLYEANKAAVWDGNALSNWFETNRGVKQGCLLSPLLFALFLDDLSTQLPGGVTFDSLKIKTLLYADDIVIMAESHFMLQTMINRLVHYCVLWNLKINTDKSKIMVFRTGNGRYARAERWFLDGEELERVREYKYLGVIITPNLNFKKHLKEKLRESKLAINCNWKSLLSNKNISSSTKYRLFDAAVRSIMCYAAEVWGIMMFDEVEALLRYFIKKMFRLPLNTPTYMIHIETGLTTLYTYTLKLHFNYIRKVMILPDHRLPKIITKILLKEGRQFFKEWNSLSTKYNVDISLERIASWQAMHDAILVKINDDTHVHFEAKALQSDSRHIYRILNHNLPNNYFHDKYSISEISTIFKTRGQLLTLNHMPHIRDENTNCTLCNLNAKEDVIHFLGVCPILNELRLYHLGKAFLSTFEVYSILNGKNWKELSKYVSAALKYRHQIINEAF